MLTGQLAILIDRYEALKLQKEALIKNRQNHRKITDTDMMLKQVAGQLNTFGSKHTIIRVQVLYHAGDQKKVTQIYFTGITPEEAIQYTRYKLTGKGIIEINAHIIIAGKPITIG